MTLEHAVVRGVGTHMVCAGRQLWGGCAKSSRQEALAESSSRRQAAECGRDLHDAMVS